MENLGFKENVLPHLCRWLREKTPSALVTLIDADGSSPRPVGSQMAVNQWGQYIGQITGGCSEIAIVQLAKEVIQRQSSEVVRFGEGSPYLDITLPCGTSIDVLFSYQENLEQLENIISGLKNRTSQTLKLPYQLLQQHFKYSKEYTPPIQLIIMGSGPIMLELHKQAEHLEFQCLLVCDDESTQNLLESSNLEFLTSSKFDPKVIDAQTAIAVLFHDHEKEAPLFRQTLGTQAFYIGALGSAKTQTRRKEILLKEGHSQKLVERIRGPHRVADWIKKSTDHRSFDLGRDTAGKRQAWVSIISALSFWQLEALADLGETTNSLLIMWQALLRWLLEEVLKEKWGQIVLVCGYEKEKVSALAPSPIEFCYNPHFDQGMGKSLSAGIGHLRSGPFLGLCYTGRYASIVHRCF